MGVLELGAFDFLVNKDALKDMKGGVLGEVSNLLATGKKDENVMRVQKSLGYSGFQ